ncbi:iron export ABC transporter permease subunit FetB [Alicyclobacillus tolerans]|uniref:ABC transporter permease n=1 Tax=Alicyclobacillus tolerans TaxID=90970 RepID=UPI001F1FF470|nr:iron export ABC transporter permease subunit FetB [Alicyclobacillus tolerans]MCF8566244.1 iron export ABC transporter permease subunit FetB [Alicyclobacillus tolerans]
MSLFTLSLTLGFVALAMALSYALKLGLERDMLVATVRATIQLLIVGYVLKAVFDVKGPVLVSLMILLMLAAATQNARKRGAPLRGIAWRILVSIGITEAISLALLLGLHMIQPTPRYVIPISGMIIGNSMINGGLFLNRLKAETAQRKAEVLVLLALGGTPKQAIRDVLKASIRASMIPTIDSNKTIGLVQLPGMMTGLIIAGADPIDAVRYQLLIVFSIMAAAALTSILLGFLTYPVLFNEHQQLIDFS